MPGRPQKKQRTRMSPETRMLIRQGLFGLCIAIVIGLTLTAIWHGTRIESLTLSTITIVGGETVSHDEVREKVEQELSGAYFRLIPARFAWLYPETKIRESVSSIERVNNVAVERVSGTEISIVFDEYAPHALWCVEDDTDTCFFVDRNGYAFTLAPVLRGESLVRYFTLGREPKQGAELAERDTLRDIEWFIEQLERELGLFAVRVELDIVGDVFFTLSRGGELKVSLLESKEDAFENLKTILASEEFEHIEPGNFRYIDLRFGNKIFVNEEIAAPEVDTASSTASSTARE